MRSLTTDRIARRRCGTLAALALAGTAIVATAQTPAADADRQAMMRTLGITALVPGASGDPAAPDAANTQEARANPYPLPDPLRAGGGPAVRTAADWWARARPAIALSYERDVYGRIPAAVPPVRWQVVAQDRETIGSGHAVIARRVIGTVANPRPGHAPVRLRMMVVLPADAPARVPVLMMFGPAAFPAPAPPDANETDRSPPPEEQLIAAGWGVARIDPLSAQPDSGAGLTAGIIGLVNRGARRTPDQWGALRAWGWAASRGLDWLAADPGVDAGRIGIEGVSRYGKAALVAMAFDRRFAIALIGSSGKGGATPLRRNFGEAVGNLATGEYHWMAGNFLRYDTRGVSAPQQDANDLTVDANGLIALCAPRPVFVSYGIPEAGDATWLDQHGSWMATVDASRVYRLLGADGVAAGDYRTEPMPALLEARDAGALAWRQHAGGHTDAPNMASFLRWAARQLPR